MTSDQSHTLIPMYFPELLWGKMEEGVWFVLLWAERKARYKSNEQTSHGTTGLEQQEVRVLL